MRSARFAVVLAVLLVLSLTPVAFAQKISGTISGTVTDPSGAVVPGAAVTITDQATNAARTSTTSGTGSYSFQDVDAGTYSVKVTKTGFKDYVAKDVLLHVSSVAT